VEVKREWTLIAPLGQLPDPPTLKEVGSLLEKDERRYRKRTLLGGYGSYALVVKNALEKVRAAEGVLSFQQDGGGLLERLRGSSRFIGTSVLVAVGVHANRSVYVLQYGRKDMWVAQGYTRGNIPDYTRDLLAKLHKNPEARRELEVLERRLSERYPALRQALEKLGNQGRPLFLQAVERGQLLFLVAQTNRITHLLVGTSLLPLRDCYGKSVDWNLLRAEDSLKPLPLETLKALLQGEGDVEEAERRLALARLAEV
jgi:hypothetical protein